MESRALSLANIRFFGDKRVQGALDSKEEREGKWCQKFSPATFVKGLINEVVPPVAVDENRVSGQVEGLDDSLSGLPSNDGAVAPAVAPVRPSDSLTRKKLKGLIQSGVQDWVSDFWKEKIGHYVMQGDYMALIMEEGNCITWKSFLWDVPQGVLKFAINAGINTLPTLDNLKRWGKRVNDRCPFCGNIQTLLHVLSNCSVALDQGRYTWRHNSVLSSIIDVIRPRLKAGFVLFSDLPGLQAPHGGTIPPHVHVTALRPDLVVINESTRDVVIFELTCPWDGNIDRSHSFKEDKYAPLVADMSRGFNVHLFSVEVSVRGQLSKANRSRLKAFAYRCCEDPKTVTKLTLGNSSRASLLCSYSIFMARKEPTWASPNSLVVR